MCNSLWPHGLKHTWLPCPSPTLGVCSNTCPLSQWCYLTVLSFATHFSFCSPSFPASGSFPMSWLFTPGGQNIGASASASVLPTNIQCWFPSGLTGLIALLSKGLSRVFSSTTIQKHQFFGTRPSLWPSSHIRPYMTTGKTTALIIWSEKDLRLTKKHLEQRDKQRLGCGSLNKELHRIYSPSVPMFTCKCATLSCQLFLFGVSIWD